MNDPTKLPELKEDSEHEVLLEKITRGRFTTADATEFQAKISGKYIIHKILPQNFKLLDTHI